MTTSFNECLPHKKCFVLVKESLPRPSQAGAAIELNSPLEKLRWLIEVEQFFKGQETVERG